jgi:hypothetical protein
VTRLVSYRLDVRHPGTRARSSTASLQAAGPRVSALNAAADRQQDKSEQDRAVWATSTFHKSARHARLRGRPAVARGRLPAGLLGTRARGIQTAGIRPAATGTSRTPPRWSSGHSSRFPAAGSLTSARLQEPHSSFVRCRHAGGSGITGGTVVDDQAHRDYRRWRFAGRCRDPFRHQDGRGPPSPARPHRAAARRRLCHRAPWRGGALG